MQLKSVYEPHEIEKKLYNHWMEKDYFKVTVDKNKKPFTILIPPPNVTGSLHMGHALDNTIQDIIIRFRRMQGYNALWIPGTDHAGIATQNKVEKEIAEEGLTRKDLGREEFLKRVWAWKEKYGRNIVYQLQRLGVSCDWSRERFTMDSVCSRAVKTAFKALFDKGLIYRGKYIINWCPRCLTALSDLEVLHEETEGNLYHINYPFLEGDGGVIVATTRPETMLGDTAVAVHPHDEKYKTLTGKTLVLPILNRKIPLIGDEYVDPSFGTGAVKITPAHDPNDFEVGNRHKLEQIVVIDEKGIMTAEAGPYKGMSREECRKQIIDDLKAGGFLVKVEPYMHGVGKCYRCNTSIEPHISEQWFCKMKDLARPAIEAVQKGHMKFFPDKYKDLYLYWMENIKDWCISRQLWWGHRIPVWYCDDCNKYFASIETPLTCEKCNSSQIHQESDVLDTWFSSGLWPLSTMGWPEETEDIKYFYPTSVLVTARDIIYLWVARMMMMGLEFKGDVPFHHVFIHATILNSEGKRMSKSLGTGIDPLDLIDKYGTDATRFGLTYMIAQGQDVKFMAWYEITKETLESLKNKIADNKLNTLQAIMNKRLSMQELNDNLNKLNFTKEEIDMVTGNARFSEEKLEMSRNFANKIWNATRFALMNLEGFTPGSTSINDLELDLPDKWIISRYTGLVTKMTYSYANYEFSEGVREFYEFFWNEFCDWYLEISKLSLNSPDEKRKFTVQYVLWYILTGSIKLLHPVMPFITEELWSYLPGSKGCVMFAEWPSINEQMIDKQSEEDMNTLSGIIKSVRTLRGDLSIAPSKEIQIYIEAPEEHDRILVEKHHSYISKLGKISDLTIRSSFEKKPEMAFSNCFQTMVMYMPVKDLIDIDQEKKKLAKEIEKLEKDLAKINHKLTNKEFLGKAPQEIINKEKSRQEETAFKLNSTKDRLAVFNNMA